jgi:hypothetical protein
MIVFIFVSLIVISVSSNPVEIEKHADKYLGKYGHHFQGDLQLTKDQLRSMTSPSNAPIARTGLIDKRYRWSYKENGKVVIPYQFEEGEEYGKSDVSLSES